MLILCTETRLLIVLHKANLPDRHIMEKMLTVNGKKVNKAHRDRDRIKVVKMSVKELKDKSGIQGMFRMMK